MMKAVPVEQRELLVEEGSTPVLVERVPDLPEAPWPAKATRESACFDLCAAEAAELRPGRVTLVRTGLKMRPPPGTFLEIRPRSGLSTRGILMPNSPGTVDRDYAREVLVPLTLLFGERWEIRPGDRVAQIRLVREEPTRFEGGPVEETGERRGGFGSTGR